MVEVHICCAQHLTFGYLELPGAVLRALQISHLIFISPGRHSIISVLQTWKWLRGVGLDQGHTASQGATLMSVMGLAPSKVFKLCSSVPRDTSCWVLSYCLRGGRRMREGRKWWLELEYPSQSSGEGSHGK